MVRWRREGHEVHLTYCLNMHPSYTLDEIKSSIREYTLPLKERLFPDTPFGTGLRLSYDTVETFHKNEDRLHAFRSFLDDHGLYVFTLNAFPAGQFQASPVKEDVFKPTWLHEERVQYTRWAAETLLAFLDEGETGTISTMPGSFRPWGHSDRQNERIMANLLRVAYFLHQKRESTGKEIQLCIEPEPLCTFQKTSDLIDFFDRFLLKDGVRQYTDAFSLSEEACREIILRHVGICPDTAHMAVLYEDSKNAVQNLYDHDLSIGKLQLSSAPVLLDPAGDEQAVEQFLDMAEDRFLHQTAARGPDGELHVVKDLPELRNDHLEQWLDFEEWRTHFHVPVFLEKFGHLYTSQEITKQVLDSVLDRDACAHFEIEPYALDCIPDDLRKTEDITDEIDVLEQEFAWAGDALRSQGFRRAPVSGEDGP